MDKLSRSCLLLTSRFTALFLILALSLPGVYAEPSRSTLRQEAGLEETNPKFKQEFLRALGVSPQPAAPAAGLEEGLAGAIEGANGKIPYTIYPGSTQIGEVLARRISDGLDNAHKRGHVYILALPRGSTFSPTVQALIRFRKEHGKDPQGWEWLRVVLLNDYVDHHTGENIPPKNPDSAAAQTLEMFRPSQEDLPVIRGEQIWVPQVGKVTNLLDQIRQLGGVNLMLVAVGPDGSVGHNFPSEEGFQGDSVDRPFEHDQAHPIRKEYLQYNDNAGKWRFGVGFNLKDLVSFVERTPESQVAFVATGGIKQGVMSEFAGVRHDVKRLDELPIYFLWKHGIVPRTHLYMDQETGVGLLSGVLQDSLTGRPDHFFLRLEHEDAASELGRIGPSAAPAVNVLIKTLKSKHPSVREQAATALGEIGPAAVPAVGDLVAIVQKRRHPEEIREEGDQRIREDEERVRPEAVRALSRIGGQEAISALAGILDGDENKRVRAAAARGLAKMGPEAVRVVPKLVRALADPSHEVRRAAVFSLADIVCSFPSQVAQLEQGQTSLIVKEALRKLAEFDPITAVRLAAGNAVNQIKAAAGLEEKGKNPESAKVPLKQARKLRHHGFLQKSLDKLNKALAEDPDNVEILTAKGDLLVRRHGSEEALAATGRALELDPDNVSAYTVRARAFNNLGRYQEALAATGRALELDPNNVSTHLIRVRTFDGLGLYLKAEETLRSVLAIRPEDARVQFAVGLHYLGRKDYWAQAKRAFEEAVRLNPKNPLARYYIAQIQRAGEGSSALPDNLAGPKVFVAPPPEFKAYPVRRIWLNNRVIPSGSDEFLKTEAISLESSDGDRLRPNKAKRAGILLIDFAAYVDGLRGGRPHNKRYAKRVEIFFPHNVPSLELIIFYHLPGGDLQSVSSQLSHRQTMFKNRPLFALPEDFQPPDQSLVKATFEMQKGANAAILTLAPFAGMEESLGQKIERVLKGFTSIRTQWEEGAIPRISPLEMEEIVNLEEYLLGAQRSFRAGNGQSFPEGEIEEIRRAVQEAHRLIWNIGGSSAGLEEAVVDGVQIRRGGRRFEGYVAREGRVEVPQSRRVLSLLEPNEKTILVPLAGLEEGPPVIYKSAGLELAPELVVAIGSDRIISLPAGLEEAEAFWAARPLTSGSMILLDAPVGTEEKWLPPGWREFAVVVNVPNAVASRLTPSQLAGLGEAARFHGGMLRVKGLFQSDMNLLAVREAA